jgi:hypothetical protein
MRISYTFKKYKLKITCSERKPSIRGIADTPIANKGIPIQLTTFELDVYPRLCEVKKK